MSLFDGVPEGSPVDEWINPKALAAKGHSADNPFEVEGTVQTRKVKTSSHPRINNGVPFESDVVVFVDDDGKVWGVSGNSTMFRNQVEASDPRPGVRFAYRYEGMRPGPKGPYHVQRLMTPHYAEDLKSGKAKKPADVKPPTAKVDSFEDSRELPF